MNVFRWEVSLKNAERISLPARPSSRAYSMRRPFCHTLLGVLSVALAGCAAVDHFTAPPPRAPTAKIQVVPPAMGTTSVTPSPERVASAIRHAQQGDPAASVATLAQIGGWPERTAAITQVAETIAAADRARALALVTAFPAGLARDVAAESASRAIVRTDPATALEWALTLPDASSRTQALRISAFEIGRREPQPGLERVFALPAGSARDEAARTLASAWVQHDANAAVAWLRTGATDEVRRVVTASMAFELAQTNPRLALELGESLPPGLERRSVVLAAVATWAAQDHAGAVAWARQLPAGEARDLALHGIASADGSESYRAGAAPPMRRRR